MKKGKSSTLLLPYGMNLSVRLKPHLEREGSREEAHWLPSGSPAWGDHTGNTKRTTIDT
ncbi:MAG: hypothetical protein LW838_02730 [Nitrosomonadaceae bacterium]|nr:hypothetical protein [Nitrosomonadaceae bacterium]